MTADHSIADVRFEKRGRAGIVVLDRPKALNALTLAMVEAMAKQLADWASDADVAQVILTSASPKAFCAGGDIRHIHDLGRAGAPNLTAFFHEEYRLNRAIHRFPKPVTSLIDGICMGGGVGLSAHAPHRVGSEKTLFAMPEVTIGFFPDVGGSHLLSRLPGEVGAWLAMTGTRLGAADALAAGFLTHVVASHLMGELLEVLTTVDDPAPVLAAFHKDPGPSVLAERRPAIDRLFAGDDALAIVHRLEHETGPDGEWAHATAADIRTKSPTSVAIALRQVRLGKTLAFEDCMTTEFRIVTHILTGNDFYEGVRSVLVDRDNRPVWRPARLEDLDKAEIEAHFTTVPPEGDLTF